MKLKPKSQICREISFAEDFQVKEKKTSFSSDSTLAINNDWSLISFFFIFFLLVIVVVMRIMIAKLIQMYFKAREFILQDKHYEQFQV